MKDYASMSDFEINAAVFEALHGGAPDYKEGDGGAMILISYEGDVVGGDAVEMEVERGLFNPCNNPADAWPIIVDNKISTYHSIVKWDCSAIVYDKKYSGGFNISRFSSDAGDISSRAALRAAMIVFLMMEENQND